MKHIIFAAMLLLAQGWSGSALAHTEHGLAPVPAKTQKAAPAPAAPVQVDDGAVAPEPVPAAAAEEEVYPDEPMEMLHPGLPEEWRIPAGIVMFAITLWALFARFPAESSPKSINLAAAPLVGGIVRFLNRSPYPLLSMKVVSVGVFLMVVVAGLFGTTFAEHNLATALVWNLWWPLVVVSVLFLGTAWCAICPWNTLANWLVRWRLWRRRDPHPGRNRKVPRYLQNVWPALFMFMGLTWLETGIGVTGWPLATALMAIIMLVLSVIFMLLYERKAFCRYACPVGRTLGYYSRLAPVSVRPVEQSTCDTCKTLECYNGSKDIEPCPTHLVVGRFSQNTNCLSCGSCMLSCPKQNVTWRLRPLGSEAKDQSQARPQWDGAWFMLALLGITIFHGLTMMEFWGEWVGMLAGLIGETGKPLISFTVAMLGVCGAVVVAYAAAIGLAWLGNGRRTPFKTLFVSFAFVTLPLAFVYHLAHNLDHLSRESANLVQLFTNPLGTGLAALSASAKHDMMMDPILPEFAVFTLQAGLMVLGFWLAVQIVRHRARGQLDAASGVRSWRLLPLVAFIAAITSTAMWLMAQGMVMRF
ncbi:4Fe-4S binding protein [Noviherbaspirillum sp. ST9]|uniref:4Fe-4S binding protein n=1 Tax=Noviherbaspirillum sp. ST9 TaxID=3401606 RepID=UPI003B58B38A